VRGGGCQHESTVARAKVDDSARIRRRESFGLADVHLEDRATVHDSHDGQCYHVLTRSCRSRP
jgi:hypothetical protein